MAIEHACLAMFGSEQLSSAENMVRSIPTTDYNFSSLAPKLVVSVVGFCSD